ncbi:mitochondrial amidoxime-reducing component 1 [Parasteatoda tepidariorum]|uniref:mitochondrial amidoxime-reducing component 1 n=1 Tax=Parasteatoda tepidariorum TaxID=114398 RepID=UPI00077F8F01|nr:mitochondrial amidoxime-reducing component 1 [Parasteatoda tepidariorum]XP_042906860.1 mitochondrial amidoxime-reducing component 1 [Parasteatoda tepidariorum]
MAGWNGWFVVPVLAIAAMGALIWKKKQRVYQRVGHVKKILFFPMKSIRGIEVEEGKCTKLGLEVNGLLERSFMLTSEDGAYVTLEKAPKLALLTPKFDGTNLVISGPEVDPLTIKVQKAPDPNDKIIECRLRVETAYVVDCGEKAAKWFQNCLNMPNVRLVRFYPEFPGRQFFEKFTFYEKLRPKNSMSLQNWAPFHIMSQPSIDDLNTKLKDNHVSAINFRPNVLVDGCHPYDEDSWEFIKLGDGAEIMNVIPCHRCPLTTFEPETGILSQKEPLVTLRKYRIPKDPEVQKKVGPRPCLGVNCIVLQTGTIKVNDEIFATTI